MKVQLLQTRWFQMSNLPVSHFGMNSFERCFVNDGDTSALWRDRDVLLVLCDRSVCFPWFTRCSQREQHGGKAGRSSAFIAVRCQDAGHSHITRCPHFLHHTSSVSEVWKDCGPFVQTLHGTMEKYTQAACFHGNFICVLYCCCCLHSPIKVLLDRR